MKLFIYEDGTLPMLQLLQTEEEIVVSSLSGLEARSAFLRREAMGELAAADVAALEVSLTEALLKFTIIPLSDRMLRDAIDLLRSHRLRTLDALQLSAAREWKTATSLPEFLFVAADDRLLNAAKADGFQIWNPVRPMP